MLCVPENMMCVQENMPCELKKILPDLVSHRNGGGANKMSAGQERMTKKTKYQTGVCGLKQDCSCEAVDQNRTDQ